MRSTLSQAASPARCAARAALLALALLVPTVAFAQGGTPASAGARQATKDLRLFLSWFGGSFAAGDRGLRVAPVWPTMSSAHWFYLEGSRPGGALDQRVVRVSLRDDRRIDVAVFALPAPSRFAGEWKKPMESRLATLAPDSLTARAGCGWVIRKMRDGFGGGTDGSGCAMSADVEVYSDRIVLLERAAGTTSTTAAKKGATLKRTGS